jgi:hypothetical protein
MALLLLPGPAAALLRRVGGTKLQVPTARRQRVRLMEAAACILLCQRAPASVDGGQVRQQARAATPVGVLLLGGTAVQPPTSRRQNLKQGAMLLQLRAPLTQQGQ